MKRSLWMLLVLLLVGAAIATLLGFYLRASRVHSQVRTLPPSTQPAGPSMLSTPPTSPTPSTPAGAYLYYTLKSAKGFVLARAPRGASGQPVGSPQPIMLLGNNFGLSEADSVSSMQLSPDGRYLAIDGAGDHGDRVWIYDTQRMTIGFVPAYVMGNFLHWLQGSNGHSFLYRPMFPLGPDAPMDGNGWNPGLWIVDAATGTHKNIDIGVPSADLIDAAVSPDDTRIVYSVTPGLGMGSDTWLMNSDGSGRTHLFNNAEGAQAIVGLFAWSPDGRSIAYERLSDSPTPFLPASLWVMNSQGGQQRWLAQADGGHGYWPVWSPDSSKIAFVTRTNVSNRLADVQAQSLQCAISVVDVSSGHAWVLASTQQTGMQMNVDPSWTADSASVVFTAMNPVNRVVGGTPRYWSAHVSGPRLQPQVAPISPLISNVVAAD